ncbi:MAG: ABC transporter ATP-binding protein [Kiritimatiellae bacterium]|nr:ABC transporter ATP-binding protein [Kiritimatiellia bacterium]
MCARAGCRRNGVEGLRILGLGDVSAALTEAGTERYGGNPYGTWALTRRMLALAWEYRAGCVRILAIQLTILTLGMIGLSFTGLGVDYLRCELAADRSTLSAAPAANAPRAGRVWPARVAPLPKPPRWPLGVQPPAGWPRTAVLSLIALAVLLFALVRSFLNAVCTIMVNRLVQGRLVVRLRAEVYAKMQRLSFRFFDANASGSLINRVTGDVQGVRMFVDVVLMQAVIVLISLAVYAAYMARLHAGLAAACLATTPLLWYATARFSGVVRPAYSRSRELFDDQILVLSENVQGMHVVKGFARQAEEIAKFDRACHAVRDQKAWIFRGVSLFHPALTLLTHANLVVLLGYGGLLAIRYEQAADAATAAAVGLSIGHLLVFAGLLQQFSGQVANIGNIADGVQQSLTSARRVFEVLDAPVEVRSPAEPAPLQAIRGAVAFDGVTFAYKAGSPALADVSFSVEPGQVVAVLGTTGSGKSTLLSLIPRFYDATAGRVLIDGHDVRTLDLDRLRRAIGIVFQESFLFSNTIRANLAFGCPDASAESIERAARIAAAHEFVMALPKGYDTVLREGGADLSGGQRQRLAIARAILLEPAILLLDDPTAAIDPETEGEMLDAMESAMRGRTTFVVAHRLSTLRRADRVLVLEQGRVVQAGTHGELMRSRGHYRHAARLQSPDEESLRILSLSGEFGG